MAPVAWACAFHGYTPRPTLIDILYDSEQVILARPDTSNQSRFQPVEALAGALDLVELNPFLDERGRTASLMVDLTASAFGRRVFDRPTRAF